MVHEYWFWVDGHKIGSIETPELLKQREIDRLESEFNYRNKISGVRLLRAQTPRDFKINYVKP